MKILLVLLAMGASLSAFACPNITGSFYDADNETTINITQDACTSSTWTDEDGPTTLIADNVERVLESEGNMTAYAKVTFAEENFVLDIRMDWGGHNDYNLPVRWITSYRVDGHNNMVEKIQPFQEDGTELATDYITLRRVN